MSQVEYYTAERRNWWERLFNGFISRAEDGMGYELPPDSLLSGMWAGAGTVADVPESVKAQIREEAVLSTFNRLESSLRLLLYATTPDRQPPTAEDCHQILNVWRYELEHQVNLTPDTYCGAVQRYEPEMDAAYIIDGRCEPGALLRIRVPCWRMNERIVVRGEAELFSGAEVLAAGSKQPAVSGGSPAAAAEAPATVAAAPAVDPASLAVGGPVEMGAPAAEHPAESPAKTPAEEAAELAALITGDAAEPTGPGASDATWDELVTRARAEHTRAQSDREADGAPRPDA